MVDIFALMEANQPFPAQVILATFERNISLEVENASLKSELDRAKKWAGALEDHIKRLQHQLYGKKSERFIDVSDDKQLPLLKIPEETRPPKVAAVEKITYERSKPQQKKPEVVDVESLLKFNEHALVEEIILPEAEETAKVAEDQKEQIGEEITYRVAQYKTAYHVKKFIRRKYKLYTKDGKESGIYTALPAPQVIEKSVADVTLLAGLTIDKFLRQLPLYRIHQALIRAGIFISRGSLTNYELLVANILEPVYQALLRGIYQGHILTMDETPRLVYDKKAKQMKRSYLWAVMGELGDFAYVLGPSRSSQVAREIISECKNLKVLLTDGYEGYAPALKSRPEVLRAYCNAHARRHFEKALRAFPSDASYALRAYQKLFIIEREAAEKELTGSSLVAYRQEHAKPIFADLLQWSNAQLVKHYKIPSQALPKACGYFISRYEGLTAYLSRPEVPISSNHIEREIRPQAIGRKNHLFNMSEIGAKGVCTLYTIIQNCTLHGVDHFDYLVDVLLRIADHPQDKVELLTPRLWKETFSKQPLKALSAPSKTDTQSEQTDAVK
jgi:transposase